MDATDSNKQRYLATLRGEIPDRVPLHETILNGRYLRHVLGECDYEASHEMPPELQIPLLRRIGLDMASLGFYWRPTALNTWARLEEEVFPPLDGFLERVDRHLAALRGEPLGLLVYVHGPLDTTYLSMGYMEFFMSVNTDPALVEAVMDRFTAYHRQLIEELVKRPIDVIQIVDDIAMKQGTFLEPRQQRGLWLPRMEQLIEPIRKAGIPMQFHSDGNVEAFIEDVIAMGFSAINPIEPLCNDIREVKRRWGDRITLMGNLDIGGVLSNGTPEQVEAEMRDLLRDLMPGGRYIAMSGSSIADCVDPRNYDAMVRTVKRHGRYG